LSAEDVAKKILAELTDEVVTRKKNEVPRLKTELDELKSSKFTSSIILLSILLISNLVWFSRQLLTYTQPRKRLVYVDRHHQPLEAPLASTSATNIHKRNAPYHAKQHHHKFLNHLVKTLP